MIKAPFEQAQQGLVDELSKIKMEVPLTPLSPVEQAIQGSAVSSQAGPDGATMESTATTKADKEWQESQKAWEESQKALKDWGKPTEEEEKALTKVKVAAGLAGEAQADIKQGIVPGGLAGMVIAAPIAAAAAPVVDIA